MNKTDVLILGGGLAGLCLARQLKLSAAELDVVIVESAKHPVPVAAHKVGESTVEIGAHYLAETLQLRCYLDQQHLKKFGLRCFFGNAEEIDQADEIGASQSLQVSSYQVDRGLLENHLTQVLRSDGVTIHDGARVTKVEFDDIAAGQVTFETLTQAQKLGARWVIDASGRRGLLRRQFGLRENNGLNGNAAWFRVNQRIRIDDWSTNTEWQERIRCGERWLSTNHLMGDGYWVWLIPLSSGATSIGIVTDADKHAIKDFTSYDKTLAWLGQNQPQCAQALAGIAPMDFRWLRHYSYGCTDVFSQPEQSQRWALTGEASLFIDPFYSPGMDFIAYANTYITDLLRRDKAGDDIRSRQLFYNQVFLSVYQSSLQLYRQQYGGFGNFHLMSLKTVWDYAYYWGVLGTLFVNDSMTDMTLFSSRARALAKIRQTHDDLQQRFFRHASHAPVIPATRGFTDHSSMPLLCKLNAELDERLTGNEVAARLDSNLARLHHLSAEITQQLTAPAGGALSFSE